jgi:hypothetical protein
MPSCSDCCMHEVAILYTILEIVENNRRSRSDCSLLSFQVRFGDATNALKPLVHQTVLHPVSFEFPAVHPYRHGLDTWYTYMMVSSDPKRPRYSTAVLKHDLHGKGTKFWESEGVTGGTVLHPSQWLCCVIVTVADEMVNKSHSISTPRVTIGDAQCTIHDETTTQDLQCPHFFFRRA